MNRLRTSRSTIKNDPFEAVIPTGEPPRRPRGRPPGVRPLPTEPVVANDTPPPDDQPGPARVVAPAEPPPEPAETPSSPTPVPPVAPAGRQKLTVHLDADVVNRLKNAAYWNPRLTITRIAERGIRQALKEVEREYGGAYPQREGELVGGRPIK